MNLNIRTHIACSEERAMAKLMPLSQDMMTKWCDMGTNVDQLHDRVVLSGYMCSLPVTERGECTTKSRLKSINTRLLEPITPLSINKWIVLRKKWKRWWTAHRYRNGPFKHRGLK